MKKNNFDGSEERILPKKFSHLYTSNTSLPFFDITTTFFEKITQFTFQLEKSLKSPKKWVKIDYVGGE